MSWQEHAACIDTPMGMFFPAPGIATTSAIAICNECPVRAECLDEALLKAYGDDHGVRGGMSRNARRDLHKARRKTS